MKILGFLLIVAITTLLCYVLSTNSKTRTNRTYYKKTPLRSLHEEDDQAIIAGTPAAANEFPWYAKFEGTKLCGGSIIDIGQGDAQFVLTAAHCVDEGYTPNQIRVGSTSFSSGGTLYRVTQKFIHPDYTPGGSYDNDIALLKIATTGGRFLGFLWPCNCRVPSSIAVNTNANFPTSATALTVMGFGVTNNQNVPSARLNKLTVNYISNEECSTNYGSFSQDIKLCADKDNAGVCAGDSGGPLVVKDVNDGSWSQVGIVSVGRQGCASDFPDYYTRVSAYSNGTSSWIQTTINQEMAVAAPDRESMWTFLQRNGEDRLKSWLV